MAIDLVSRALLRPGDVVAVEALGYRPAWEALRASGATLVPVRVDRHGLDVARLAELAETTPLRAVYVTPHHQYPTTVVLGAPRRLALLELARRSRFAILEDDYDHELHYEGRPILPLASRAPRSVIYVGTLSKVLAPGLRLGWVVAPSPLREAIIAHRTYVDRQGDHVLEHAIAELAEDGELARHTLRMRRVYLGRRDFFVSALRETFGERLRFEVPRGGMALWANARGVDVDAWAERAAERGVYVQTARRFTFDRRPRAALRLGFGALDEAELGRAIGVLAKTL
jgi:GntR family transcriptional regulator/MocR family aminotransferase